MKNSFVIKGDICYSKSPEELCCMDDSYLAVKDGICMGVFRKLPGEFSDYELKDCTRMLVLPGMTDLHIHAPQYAFRGMGMDLELLKWLEVYTFPEEEKYRDRDYAEKAYGIFTESLKNSATTRAVIFATVHREATVMLMDMLEDSGIDCYVGKVNMDMNAPDGLRELSPESSATDTRGWLEDIEGRYTHVRPILTPRFLPSCSGRLLEELSALRKEYGLPVQSHLSENPGEVELVHRLFPEADFYGEGYDRYGIFGGEAKTVMAHCIYSTDEEAELIKERGVYVAHCPASNMNLASGIAPIRKYLNMGISVGLGSDVAGGESESIFRCISDAVQVSKLYSRLVDSNCSPLKFEEAFYMGTVGGGSFFGRVGSFEPGYEADIVVIDDAHLSIRRDVSLRNRLERAVYLEADDDSITEKYVAGRSIHVKKKRI